MITLYKKIKTIILSVLLLVILLIFLPNKVTAIEKISIVTMNSSSSVNLGFPSINENGVVVFTSNGNLTGQNTDGGDELFVGKAFSFEATQITNLGSDDFIGFFRIAGRSNIITFTTNGNPLGTNADKNIEVFTINSDGTKLTQITNTLLPVQNTFVSINPSGEVTAFQCTTKNPPNIGGEAEKICLANFNGSSVVRLTEPESFQFASPTITSFPFIMVTPVLGNHLVAFSTTKLNLVPREDDVEGGASFEIFTAEVDQNLNPLRFRQLTSTPIGDLLHKFTPRISEEGNVVAFVNSTNKENIDLTTGTKTFTPVSRIDVINTDGTNLTMLYPTFEKCGDPTVNANGSKIVFSCKADFLGKNPDKNSEIFVSNRDGAELTQLTDTNSGDNFFPYIDPTGNFIVWESTANINGQNPDGNPQIYLHSEERQPPPSMGKPKIQVPPGFSFIDTKVGQTTTNSFNIENVGDADLVVSRIIPPPAMSPFMIAMAPNPPFTIGPGQSISVEVDFSPTMTSMSLSIIRIKSNDPQKPLAIVDLFGKGIQAELTGQILKAKENKEQTEEGISFVTEAKIAASNTGDADSGAFSVAVFLSEDKFLDQNDELLKELPAANLPPKTNSVIEEKFERKESIRGKFLIINVDNLDQVAEKNEKNNIKSGRIR